MTSSHSKACPVAACFCDGRSNTTTPCAIGGSPDWAPCPVFRDRFIVQQPADLLGLSNQYVTAATTFIAARAGRREAGTSADARTGAPFFLYYASHHVHSPQVNRRSDQPYHCWCCNHANHAIHATTAANQCCCARTSPVSSAMVAVCWCRCDRKKHPRKVWGLSCGAGQHGAVAAGGSGSTSNR